MTARAYIAGILTAAILMVAASGAYAQDYTTGLVGHWKLDETSGTTAVDSSSNGNNGSMMAGLNAGANSVGGAIGTALDFDSIDDHVFVTASGDFSNIFAGGGTFSAWIKPDSAGENSFGRIMDKRSSGGIGWLLGMSGAPTQLIFVRNFSGLALWLVDGVQPGVWNHVVVTYDEDDPTNDPVIYVNGAPRAFLVDSNSTGTAQDDSLSDIYIGESSGGDRAFDGAIDDARIYNRALSATDVEFLFNSYTCINPSSVTGALYFNDDVKMLQYCNGTDWAAIGPADTLQNGLVAHWTLDETSGTLAADSSGNGNDGTMTDGLTGANSVAGKVGTALEFDGTDDYIDAGNDLSVNGITATVTMAVWVKPERLGISESLISNSRDSSGVYDGIHLDKYSGDYYRFRVWNSIGSPFVTSTTAPAIGVWQHVVGVYDGTNVKIYVNGVEEDSSGWGTGIGSPASFNIHLGKLGHVATPVWNFDGDMDDARIYNRALSAAEIQKLFEQGDSRHNKVFATSTTHDGDLGGISGAHDICAARAAAAGLPGTYRAWISSDASDDPESTFTRSSVPYRLVDGTAIANDWDDLVDGTLSAAISIDETGAAVGVSALTYVQSNGNSTGLGANCGAWTDNTSGTTGIGGTGATNSFWSGAPATGDCTVNGYSLYCFQQDGETFSVCSNPAEPAGTILFNTTHNVMQYCDGTEWVAMGPPGDGGGGCTNPTGLAAELRYNADHNVVQYCEGDEWIAVASANNYAGLLGYGLVGHWTLDETSGPTLADSSGNGNDAAWSDGSGDDVAEETIIAAINTGIAPDGVDDSAFVTASGTVLDFISPITVALWAKHKGNDGQVLCKGHPALGGATSYCLDVGPNYRFWSATQVIDSGVAVPDTDWHHVVATLDGTTATIYLDGTSIHNEPQTMTNASDLFPIFFFSRSPLLGGATDTEVDDIRIYDRALTATEVTALYNTGSPPVSVPASGLVAHWTLDETTGSTITDSAGSNDGTWSDSADNNVTGETTAGVVSTSLTFDGGDDVIDVPEFDVTGTGITLAGWYNANSVPVDVRIISKADGVNLGDHDWALYFESSNNEIRFRSRTAGGVAQEDDPNFVYTLNTWRHIAATYNSGSGAIEYYIDGVNVGSDTHDYGGALSTSTGRTIGIGNQPTGSGARGFDGELDDIRVYDRPLTGTEVLALYNAGSPPAPPAATLVGHWTLDETTGTTAADSSGNSYDGTMTGGLDAATDSVTGPMTRGLHFDGSGDYIEIADNADLSGGTGVSKSWSFWFNIDATPASSNHLIRKDQSSSNKDWGFGYDSTDEVYFYHENGAGNDDECIFTPTFVPGTWYHISATWDGTSKTMRTYVDGAPDTLCLFTHDLIDTNTPVQIGKRGYEATNLFDGRMDDVRIYTGVLTDAEVAALYAASTGDPCSGSPAVGTQCLDGTYYAGLTPDGSVPMYMSSASFEHVSRNWDDATYDDAPADSTTDGDGNTSALDADATDHQAAEYCVALNAHGHTDWYLPAQNELNLLWNGGIPVGDILTDGSYYWSSTELSTNHAHTQRFSDGGVLSFDKNVNTHVRCVRQ